MLDKNPDSKQKVHGNPTEYFISLYIYMYLYIFIPYHYLNSAKERVKFM